jgi:hypothetical protein
MLLAAASGPFGDRTSLVEGVPEPGEGRAQYLRDATLGKVEDPLDLPNVMPS